MAPDRKWDREVVVPIICAKLAGGGRSLTTILAEFDPPISYSALTKWRHEDEGIDEAINAAFELGSDALAEQWLATAEGKTVEKGGRSTGTVERDKLVCFTIEKLLRTWNARYNPSTKLANDPDNPLPVPQFLLQPVMPAPLASDLEPDDDE